VKYNIYIYIYEEIGERASVARERSSGGAHIYIYIRYIYKKSLERRASVARERSSGGATGASRTQTNGLCSVGIRQHAPAYASICQRTKKRRAFERRPSAAM
jgi:hypothetical protein